jgi:hypothetical protein
MSKFRLNRKGFAMRLGKPGAGKTLSTTELLALPALFAGIHVYADYWINWCFPNFHYFQEFEEIAHVRNCVVLFDDMSDILDPRNWEAEGSQVRRFFIYHRKRHIEIEGNVQNLNLIAKTALNQVSAFYWHTDLNDSLLNILFPNRLRFQVDELTLQQLKRFDSGYVPFVPPSDDDDDYDEPEEDVEASWVESYGIKNLYHDELNHFKQELFHFYCPLCESRQGEMIYKSHTEKYLNYDEKKKRFTTMRDDYAPPNCPKHHDTPLEIRRSTMYDSDYELKLPEKAITWKPFAKVMKESFYRGALSDNQLQEKRNLEKNA